MPRKAKEFTIASTDRVYNDSSSAPAKPSSRGPSNDRNSTAFEKGGRSNPITNRVMSNNPNSRRSDDDESEEGWSDDSGRDSDTGNEDYADDGGGGGQGLGNYLASNQRSRGDSDPAEDDDEDSYQGNVLGPNTQRYMAGSGAKQGPLYAPALPSRQKQRPPSPPSPPPGRGGYGRSGSRSPPAQHEPDGYRGSFVSHNDDPRGSYRYDDRYPPSPERQRNRRYDQYDDDDRYNRSSSPRSFGDDERYYRNEPDDDVNGGRHSATGPPLAPVRYDDPERAQDYSKQPYDAYPDDEDGRDGIVRDIKEEDLEAASAQRAPHRGGDSIAFSETEKRHRKMIMWLLIGLASALILLAALAGGLIGAFAFQKNNPEPAAAPVQSGNPFTGSKAPAVAPAGSPSPAPVGSNPTPTTSAPTLTPTSRPNPVPPPPTPSPCIPSPFVPCPDTPVGSPPSQAPGDQIVTDQALFDTIRAASPDNGATILQAGTPQNLAFVSLQNEAQNLSPDRAIQRYALRVFFYATNGSSWTTKDRWEEPIEECFWFTQQQDQVTCEGTVFRTLYFDNNNLSGVLPDELSMLTGLTTLYIRGDLDGSGLTGTIPASLSQLTQMQVFLLDGHQFSSSIPDTLFSLWTGATLVNIYNSGVTGSIPGSVGSLTEVTNVNFENNNLQGPIPPQLMALTKMKLLSLANNILDGNLPAGWANLNDMRKLDLSGNNLSGPIPDEIGSMTQLKGGLDLSDNGFSSAVPATLNNLVSLKSLLLDNNQLSGALPDLSALSLDEFRIDGNNIVGAVGASTCNALSSTVCSGDVVCACCANAASC